MDEAGVLWSSEINIDESLDRCEIEGEGDLECMKVFGDEWVACCNSDNPNFPKQLTINPMGKRTGEVSRKAAAKKRNDGNPMILVRHRIESGALMTQQ